jgi:hypothetical protein
MDQLIQYTQTFLNIYGNAGLDTDGLIGPLTTAARNNFIAQLKIYLSTKQYEYKSDMILGVRTSDIYTDEFTDWGVIISNDIPSAFPMSTKPGSYWLAHPPTVDGITGTACISEGQYVNMWTYSDSGWSGDPYCQQENVCTVYRDNSHLGHIDRTAPQTTGCYGINFHSWKGDNSTWVYNLSEGCQVMQDSTMSLLSPIFSKFTGTIDYTIVNDLTINNLA